MLMEETMISQQQSIDSFLQEVREKHSLPEAIGLTAADLDEIAAVAVKLYEEGKLKSSLKLLEGLTSLCPEKPEYWSAVGGVLTRLERYEEAIPILTVALRMDSNNTAALVNRGECFIAMAENEKAAADLQRAIDLDPGQHDPASNRARQIVFGMYTFFQECIVEGLDEAEVSDGD
jgi:tetratricopeptide (TPR) repeat protein